MTKEEEENEELLFLLLNIKYLNNIDKTKKMKMKKKKTGVYCY